MLLCCFKEQKKRDESPDSDSEHRESQKRQSLISVGSQSSSQAGNYGRVSGAHRDARRHERAPLHREEKKLLKQRSHDGFKAQQTNMPYIDQSPPTGIAVSHPHASTSSSPGGLDFSSSCSSADGHGGDRGGRGGGGAGPGGGQCLISASSSSSTDASPLRIQAYPYSSQSSSSPVTTTTPNTASSSAPGSAGQQQPVRRREKPTHSRGMTRSSASYGIQQLLQDQIILEERAKVDEESKSKTTPGAAGEHSAPPSIATERRIASKYEALVGDLKTEHQRRIQELEQEYSTTLINAKNNNESELKWRIAEHQKELESLKVVHSGELSSLKSHYERFLATREEEHAKVIEDYQERDRIWQDEKKDVLGEIQRLKEEANRFMAILADDDESDEHLSPARRQTLTKEVESLQLVVEMRTQEVHRLREERSRQLQQLEELETTKVKLGKMQAKVEDLQAQLDKKRQVERQLSMEKSNLEHNFEQESRQKARISMQVEELQYRLRNPDASSQPRICLPGQYTSPSRPTSLPQTLIQTNGLLGLNKHHIYSPNNNSNASVVNNNGSSNGSGPMSATPTTVANNNTVVSHCQIQTALLEVKRRVPEGEEVSEEVLQVTLTETEEPANMNVSQPQTQDGTNKRPCLPASSLSPNTPESFSSDRHHHPAHSQWHEENAAVPMAVSPAVEANSDIPDIPPPPYEEASGSGTLSSSPRRLEDSLEKLAGDSQGDYSDRDSDEGLGDISSSEASSPHPLQQGSAAPVSAKLSATLKSVPEEDAALQGMKKELSSPSDERMPSRIPLSVQTAL